MDYYKKYLKYKEKYLNLKKQIGSGETEVFRITPEVGKCYKTAEYTRQTGKYPNYRYYTTNEPKLVGKFIKHYAMGGPGDGARHYSVFNLDGKEITVEYSYGGYTSFIEVKC